jgi:hypothetical protein
MAFNINSYASSSTNHFLMSVMQMAFLSILDNSGINRDNFVRKRTIRLSQLHNLIEYRKQEQKLQ